MFAKLFSLIFCILIVSFHAMAQKEVAIPVTEEWEPGGTLLDNQDMTVEIEFKLSKKQCDSSGFGASNHLFRYKIQSNKKPSGKDLFLTFKIIYQDCFGRYICKTNNLNIGVKRKNDVWDGVQPLSDPNQDNFFRGARLIVPFSDVKVVTTKDPTKDSECYKKVVSIPSGLKTNKAPTKIEAKSEVLASDPNFRSTEKAEAELINKTQEQKVKTITKSRKSDLRIKGPNGQIVRGQKFRIELSDITDTEWNWYLDDCNGQLIKSASSFYEGFAEESTTYYAKPIVNNSNKEICLNYHVIVDTVSEASYPARNLIMTKNGKACAGELVKMYPMGGLLGTDAKWQWFKNTCGGDPYFEGDTLYIDAPKENMTFYIRASGKFNTTECISKQVTIISPNTDLRKIVANNELICPGSAVKLSISGVPMEKEPTWKWSNNQNENLGEGLSITYRPFTTTAVYAKLEGICENPIIISKDLIVSSQSRSPEKVSVSFIDDANIKIKLEGGELQENSQWVWYKNNLQRKNKIFSGSSTFETGFDPKLTYLVRAEGACDTTIAIVIDSIQNVRKATYLSFGISPLDISGVQSSKTLVFSIGHIANRFGWFIKGKYAPPSGITSALNTNNTALLNYTSSLNYYNYNGEIKTDRMAVIGGFHLGLTKSFFFNIGAGYGSRSLFWGINEYSLSSSGTQTGKSFAKNVNNSASGVEIESGFTISTGRFHLTTGIGYLGLGSSSKPFTDVTVSIGINL